MKLENIYAGLIRWDLKKVFISEMQKQKRSQKNNLYIFLASLIRLSCLSHYYQLLLLHYYSVHTKIIQKCHETAWLKLERLLISASFVSFVNHFFPW